MDPTACTIDLRNSTIFEGRRLVGEFARKPIGAENTHPGANHDTTSEYGALTMQWKPLPDHPRLIDGVGLWFERLTNARSDGDPMLFLDRDGVIVEEVEYLRRPADVRLLKSASSAIRAANQRNICVALVTNQSGIGRGLLTWADFANVQNKILGELAAAGARIDLVLACAYHSSGKGVFCVDEHPWRKPNSGMIQAAVATLAANPIRSLIVGDRITDLLAGRGAGVGCGLLVKTGYGSGEAKRLSSICLEPMRVDVAEDVGSIDAWLSAQLV